MKTNNCLIHTLETGLCLLIVFCFPAHAEVMTDGTVGTKQNLAGQMTIPQGLGSTVGGNLFHSFTTFNIKADESVTFTGADSLRNVISRVTGGAISHIDGLLKSEVGHANFYFINPAGVIFGSQAQVNVPAAFHVSTANYIKFTDGNVFNAANPAASTLTIAEPASFGFLADSKVNNGLIEFNGTNLAVKQGKTLDIVARDIVVKSSPNQYGYFSAEAGDMRLAAVGKGPTNVVINGIADVAKGSILIDASTLDVSGNGAGKLTLQSGDVRINFSDLFSDNTGNRDATADKGISVFADNLMLNNHAHISADTYSSGKASAINVNAGTIDFDNWSGIRTFAWQTAKTGAGNIAIKVSQDLTLQNNSYIISRTSGEGNAGQVNVDAATAAMKILSTSQIASLTTSDFGNAGSVTVKADSLKVDAEGGITGIFAESLSPRSDAGVVSLHVNKGVEILNGGLVYTSSIGIGKVGSITLTADSLTIDGQGQTTGIFSYGENNDNIGEIKLNINAEMKTLQGGEVEANTYGTGQGGNINIKTGSLKIDSQDSDLSTGVFSNAYSSGKAGNIEVESNGKMEFLNKGKISTDTGGSGDAGTIKVVAGSLKIDGTGAGSQNNGIFSRTIASGNGGDITVESQGLLEILNGGSITSSNFLGTGNAGNITVKANALKIAQAENYITTGIFSDSWGVKGDGGNITIDVANNFDMMNGEVRTITNGSGRAGNVNIKAANLTLNHSDISAQAHSESTGKTGHIHVNASKSLQLVNQSGISIQNLATVAAANIKPGEITISAPDIHLTNSGITAASNDFINPGNHVDAGNIRIDFSHGLDMNSSFIATYAIFGNGGSISVNGGELIDLQNAGFFTSVAGNGNGGNINVAADVLVMNGGVIQANAQSGSGGDINLNLKALIPSQDRLIKGGSQVVWQPYTPGFNVIQAASATGVSGNINITSPQFNISGSLSGLYTGSLVLPAITYKPCQGVYSGSSLGPASKGGIPVRETKSVFFPVTVKRDSQTVPVDKAENVSKQFNRPCAAI